MDSPDIIIVGAGVIGTSAARELQARGLNCLLLDADEPGHGTSFGNAGIIATEQVEPLALPGSWRQVPNLLLDRGPASLVWRDIATVLPWSLAFLKSCRRETFEPNNKAFHALTATVGADWRALGEAVPAVGALTQFVGHDEVFESAQARRLAQPALLAQRADGVRWRDLDEEELADIRTRTPAVVAGVRYLDSGHVRSPVGIVQALLQDFTRRGGRQMRARIDRIEPRDGGFDLHTRSAVLHCARVLVSAGSRGARLLAPLGLRAPLIAERGYHFSFNRHLAGLQRAVLLRERSVVMTPMQFGFRSTSFVEFAAPGSAPNPAKWRRLQRHLQEAGVWMREDAPDAWMGERPTLPDYLPGLGASSRHPGLFYALGHQHLGLTLSATTARLMSDLIASDKRASFLDAFDLGRFG
jgi:D-hydroxyproline dehydrogenase